MGTGFHRERVHVGEQVRVRIRACDTHQPMRGSLNQINSGSSGLFSIF